MPKDIKSLIRDSIDAIKLNILVFGPQVKSLSPDERTRNLQLKRRQIREELETLGHNPRFAEELVDPSLGNMLMQEALIMGEYDLIITLVDSPGTNVETGIIALKPQLAQKAQFFIDAAYTGGLPAEACRLAREMGAYLQEYTYPDDLVNCHLVGFVKARVSAAQKIRYLT